MEPRSYVHHEVGGEFHRLSHHDRRMVQRLTNGILQSFLRLDHSAMGTLTRHIQHIKAVVRMTLLTRPKHTIRGQVVGILPGAGGLDARRVREAIAAPLRAVQGGEPLERVRIRGLLSVPWCHALQYGSRQLWPNKT